MRAAGCPDRDRRRTARLAPRRDPPDAGRAARLASFEAEALPELSMLHARALRLTGGDEMRSADLVQETMLRAYRSWDQFQNGTNAGAWLMTILRNAFISDFRRRRSAPTPVELDEEAGSAVYDRVSQVDPEGEFFDRLIDRQVVSAIDALPDAFRLPLVLSDLDGLSYGEVAEALQVPVGTVKSRLHRARQRLQARLYEYAVAEGYVKEYARE